MTRNNDTGHRPALICAALLALIVANPAAAQEIQTACHTTLIAQGTVASVRDGRTLVLSDGREVRLAGIETPGVASASLEKIVGGQTLRLERTGAGSDRYGRLTAFAFLPETAETVEQSLLEAGQALVSPRIDDKTCFDALLAAERRARAAKRGRWASGTDPNFAPLASEDLTKIGASRGHFVLVEGKVLSVRESGATIYMNFGRRWTKGFSVTILKRQQRTFVAAGIDLKGLEGHRVRVRGWIEQRRGPVMEAAQPGQIELID